jgi:hypothetical protein
MVRMLIMEVTTIRITIRAKCTLINRTIEIIVISLSLATTLVGANLLVCESLRATIPLEGAGVAISTREIQSDISDQVQNLRLFAFLPCCAGSVHRMIEKLLVQENLATEADRRVILKAEPASGLDWLELAKLRSSRLGPSGAFSAIDMSELTEPREIESVVQRASLYLSFWEFLPDRRQRRALNELCDAGPFMKKQALQEIKLAITKRTEKQRQAIKEQLLARGVGEEGWVKAIGL